MNTMQTFFAPHPLLRGFADSWPWLEAKGPNHANPYYSPLYYILCRGLKACNILEIGCEEGYSSYMLALAAKENEGTYFCIEKEAHFAQQVKQGCVESGFPHVIIHADSGDIDEFVWADRLDFVLLDGNHTQEAIEHEVAMLYPKLKGYIALHDTNAWSASGYYAILDNPDYDWEHISFPYNFGLALLRKRVERLVPNDDYPDRPYAKGGGVIVL